MYPHKRISALYALLLLFILIFSGCQNSNSANSATPTENRTPETFAQEFETSLGNMAKPRLYTR